MPDPNEDMTQPEEGVSNSAPSEDSARTEAEREHLRRLVEEVKKHEASIPPSGYAELDGGEPEAPADDPDKPEVITAFLVYVTPEGKAVATTQIEETLAEIKIRREAGLPDFQRACQEVANDCSTANIAQSVLELQMQMARQVQQAAQNQKVLQGLDLSGVKQ